jgi:hypothetical protein
MPGQSVDPSENVSRFLFKGDIRVPDDVIKHAAFLPPASTLEVSVFRTSELSEQAIWTLAVEQVEPERSHVKGPVIGRGDLTVSTITEEQLRVRPDQDPASRHADIVNWPKDRDARATIAMVLAAKASPAKKRELPAE